MQKLKYLSNLTEIELLLDQNQTKLIQINKNYKITKFNIYESLNLLKKHHLI